MAEVKELGDTAVLLVAAGRASSPTIRYGGSKAKGTMIKEAYDLDMTCYFGHDDTRAGQTLEDIYGNTRKALESALQKARENAIKAINTELVKANWEIGRYIVEFEQHGKEKADYGSAL